MPGYLEQYGAGDEKREKKVRWIVLSSLGAGLLGLILYFSFRDYKEEHRITGFLEALNRGDYKGAYSFWGCTAENPCREYAFDKFLEDWGEKGVNAKFVHGSLGDTERCGSGFIADIAAGGEHTALWVERSTGVVGYAPWSECPEKQFRLM